MHDQLALPSATAIPAGNVCLMVKQNQRGLFDVFADDVLIHQHCTEYEADAHCRRLQTQQDADQ
jgi:hypothetical protein